MKHNNQKLEKLRQDVNETKVKLLEHQLLVEKFEQENELTFSEDGDVIVECNIGSLSNIYSRYDMQRSKTLEPELYEYIQEETDIIPLYHSIQLNMHVHTNTTEQEEQQARKALKNHYSFTVAHDNFILKNKLKSGRMLLLVGLLCLAGSVLTARVSSVIPVYDILLILTWFSTWEAINVLVFERNRLKSGMLNMLRLYNAKVVFIRSKVPPKSIIIGPSGNQMYSRPLPPLSQAKPNESSKKKLDKPLSNKATAASAIKPKPVKPINPSEKKQRPSSETKQKQNKP